MRWQPEVGHIPRGLCGATSAPSDVRLVLVVAEPGDPHVNEIYHPNSLPEEMFETVCQYAYASFGTGRDQFHRNIRAILDDCWPSMSFHEQLRRTWITESVLCSASVECGAVPSAVVRNCVERYLDRELALFPNAVVASLGGKARNRMKALQRRYIRAGSVAPPGCNQRKVREPWKAIVAAVHAGE